MYNTFLKDLQDAVLSRLQSVSFFDAIYVYSEQQAFEADAFNAAIKGYATGGTGKGGACVIVKMCKILKDNTQSPAGGRVLVMVQVEVVENELVNRNPTAGTMFTGDQIAVQVYAALKGFKLSNKRMVEALYGDTNIIMPVPNERDKYLHTLVTLGTGWGMDFDPRVLDPQGASAGVNVQALSCPTAGAAIWYTTDGSYPSPKNTAAVQYTTPFNITGTMPVRAIAYKADCLPSNEWGETLTAVPVVPTVDTGGDEVVDTDGQSVIEVPAP
jgi:hypothetical protein